MRRESFSRDVYYIDRKLITFDVCNNKVMINYDDRYGSVEIIGDISKYESVELVGTSQNPVFQLHEMWWTQQLDKKIGLYKSSYKYDTIFHIGSFDLI